MRTYNESFTRHARVRIAHYKGIVFRAIITHRMLRRRETPAAGHGTFEEGNVSNSRPCLDHWCSIDRA